MERRDCTSWGAELASLRQWVAETDGVVLTQTSLSVARSVREEFYERVNRVQGLLVGELLGSRLEDARVLAEALAATLVSLKDLASLQSVELPSKLAAFVEHPEKALSESIFTLVIDGLSGRCALSSVESEARREIESSYQVLVRNAYEAWAYLGIVTSLAPVRFWAVAPNHDGGVSAVSTESLRIGWQVTSRELRLPEAVFQTGDGYTFAMKCEAAREIDYYDAIAPRARDTSACGNTEGMLCHRVLLLYRLGGPELVGATVNRKTKVQVPCDLAVSVLAPREMENAAYLSAFVNRLRILRTRQPVMVLTYDGGAFPAVMESDDSVPPVAHEEVGLDVNALVRAAERL